MEQPPKDKLPGLPLTSGKIHLLLSQVTTFGATVVVNGHIAMATGGVPVVVVVFVAGVVLLEVPHQQEVEDSVVVAGDRMTRVGQPCNSVG